MATSSNGPVARVLLQQCLSARLQVQPASDTEDAKYEHVVKTILNARLSEDENGKYVSILDLPGNVLIIPQATLGGRLKGKMFQYHYNIDKAIGKELYNDFVHQCTESVLNNAKCHEHGCVVKCGTYGNRQVLALDTNGPYTHHLEF